MTYLVYMLCKNTKKLFQDIVKCIFLIIINYSDT